MTKARYMELNEGPEDTLTVDEMGGGWYFSDEWDGLLIHRTWVEAENDDVGYDPLGIPEELT